MKRLGVIARSPARDAGPAHLTGATARYLREDVEASPAGGAASARDRQRRIVIAGAGGFGREVLQYIYDAMALQDGYVVKGFLDDRPPDLAALGLEVPVLGGTDGYDFEAGDRVLLAIGDTNVRLRLAERFAARGARFLTVVHPLAYVSASARLGTGCIVAPFATVGAHARLGDHTVLTFYASVAHDARVGRACGFSPHSVINGGASLGDGVFLGAFAAVNPLQTVGAGSKVAAGAVVYHAIPAGTLAVGNPARPRPLWKA